MQLQLKTGQMKTGTSFSSYRVLLFSIGLIATSTPGLAQTALEQVFLSSDIHAQLMASDGTIVTGSDQAIFEFDPESGDATILAELSTDDASLNLDALGFDQGAAMFSVDTSTTLAGMDVRPRDVVEEEGTGLVFAFVGGDNGIPADVSVDAVTRDPASGDLLLSFDRTFTLPGPLQARPADVFRFNGSGFSSVFDGSAVPENANLDAVRLLSTGNVLMSFDIDLALPGSSGPVHAADDDIVEYDPATGNFMLVGFRLRDIDDSWQAADVDAIWADNINGGKVRFTQSFRQVDEDVGTLLLKLERFDAAESPLAIEVTSVDGSGHRRQAEVENRPSPAHALFPVQPSAVEIQRLPVS
ncbi:MAG: hypothetical protein RQ847_10470 [Wenzhouxiangellaceae bacterium]|nr:hypothetical protein [Wenzhouxiangellaceae bacterium]